jgi:hypothetical protein
MAGGTGISGTGISGTGISGAGISGTGISGAGISGTGISGYSGTSGISGYSGISGISGTSGVSSTSGSSGGTGAGIGTGLTTAALYSLLSGNNGLSSTLGSGTSAVAQKGNFSKGTQISDPWATVAAVPVDTYAAPTYNPQQLQEIQQAKTGGIIHKAPGGLAGTPTLMRGQQTAHTNLFHTAGVPLTSIPGHANGGAANMAYMDRTLPEGHNPQFFSEGGLNSLHHKFVTGDGDGTSDSVPAMLANGEFVIPADVVSGLGNGSNAAGAKVLDAFLATVRAHKQKHDAKHLPPDSKGPLAYLLQAQKKASK